MYELCISNFYAPQCQIIYTLLQVSSCEINLGIELLQVHNTYKSCCEVTVNIRVIWKSTYWVELKEEFALPTSCFAVSRLSTEHRFKPKSDVIVSASPQHQPTLVWVLTSLALPNICSHVSSTLHLQAAECCSKILALVLSVCTCFALLVS